MSLPDRPTGIVLTPRAARQFKDVIRDIGVAPAFIVLGVPEEGSTDFKLDLATSTDEESEAVFNISGLNIAVPKKNVERLSGFVIDYLEAPKKGFSVVRLYAPSEDR
jgi:Fe-S cluster assembly iron-binding protein IscA